MKVIFMGTPDFSVLTLSELQKNGHEVVCVVTQPDRARDRGKHIQFTPVKERAIELGIPVLQPEKVKNNEEFYNAIKGYNADIAVVVAYGQILPVEILEIPRLGCINIHASLLPRLRGAAPIQRAIIDGEKKTGITIMQMSEGLDTGDILSMESTDIGEKNYRELHDELSIMGAKLLIKTLPLIEEEKVIPIKQDDSLSTYAKTISKSDGKIDFNNSAGSIERLIRGMDPWPGAFCSYDLLKMKIWKAHILDVQTEIQPGTIVKVQDDEICVACLGDMLVIDEIQVPGKKRMPVKDFLRGNKIEAGKILR